MAVDDVVVNSQTGVDGNSYTTAISNDKLTNDDFLKLLLEELKMQDPTKPMDSTAMMDSQLKMSTIESNRGVSESMTALQSSFAQSALANAAGLINHIVEDGQTNDTGNPKQYIVSSVEQKDGSTQLIAKEITGVDEDGNPVLATDNSTIDFGKVTRIF